jgi:tryptophan synthase beta chain
MEMLGAKVTGVNQGSKSLADAVDVAIDEWVKRIDDTFYLLGSVVGPHPYPTIVKYFQKIIGEETKREFFEKENKLPDYLVACVGGGSNAMGFFNDFLEDQSVNLIGVEAAGKGLQTNQNAATLSLGRTGVIHGMRTKVLLDEHDKIKEVYSISAGLDYPGVGPEHAYLKETNRVNYFAISDREAVEAFQVLSKTEGIIPAIESAHAVAYAMKLAKKLPKDKSVIVNLSGRGDKDVESIEKYLKLQ